MTFRWRSVQRRPAISCTITRVHHETWRLFARYDYLTAALNPAAACYLLCVDGQPASFCGVLYRPHPHAQNVYGISRSVTLPDWQGLGLAFALSDRVAGAYKAVGKRLRRSPAHPSLIRACDRSKVWSLIRKPGYVNNSNPHIATSKGFGGRPCAVFEYCGTALPLDEARVLMAAAA